MIVLGKEWQQLVGSSAVQKSLLRESNPWPFAYEANALPTELNRLIVFFLPIFLSTNSNPTFFIFVLYWQTQTSNQTKLETLSLN